MFRTDCRQPGKNQGEHLEDYHGGSCVREDDGLEQGDGSRGGKRRSDSGCILN